MDIFYGLVSRYDSAKRRYQTSHIGVIGLLGVRFLTLAPNVC